MIVVKMRCNVLVIRDDKTEVSEVEVVAGHGEEFARKAIETLEGLAAQVGAELGKELAAK